MFSKVRAVRHGVRIFWLAPLLAALAIHLAWAAPPAQSPTGGEAIFADKCAGCHTIGGGRLVGPDLRGVTAQRDRAWLVQFISEPDKVLAASDPIATALFQEFSNVPMPNLGLSQDQVVALLTYLDSQGGDAAAPTAVPATGLPAGDPDRGEALFAGIIHLQNGGPPCLGCHSADNVGLLGGGVMGPDLTQVAARYGRGLQAALAGIAWPTMAPIFARHPVTQQEQADLLAFLQAESGQQPTNREVPVLALSLAGLVGALIAIGFVWRHRLRGVRRPLVERTRVGKGL